MAQMSLIQGFDPRGAERLTIVVDAEGAAGGVSGRRGARAGLSAHPRQGVGVGVKDGTGTLRGGIVFDERMGPSVVLADQDGRSRFDVVTDPRGASGLRMADNRGRARVQI